MNINNANYIIHIIHQPYQCQCLMRPQQLQQDRDFFGSITAESFWCQFLFAAQILCSKQEFRRIRNNNFFYRRYIYCCMANKPETSFCSEKLCCDLKWFYQRTTSEKKKIAAIPTKQRTKLLNYFSSWHNTSF